MTYNKATIRVNVRGSNLVVRKLRAISPKLSTAQYDAGQALGTFFVGEAYRIIREKSPKSKGTLASSVQHSTIKARGGWNTKVFTNVPYAKVVESGGPPERKQLDPILRDWVGRVLGDKARKALRYKKFMNVRTGGNPNYNTAQGMQFFQGPFRQYQSKIAYEYQKRVKTVLSR